MTSATELIEPYRKAYAETVDRLDIEHFRIEAQTAAERLVDLGAWSGTLTPGDMTEYRVALIDQDACGRADTGGRILLANGFGPLRALPDHMRCDPVYMATHYVANQNIHTAVVLALFVRFVGHELPIAAEALS